MSDIYAIHHHSSSAMAYLPIITLVLMYYFVPGSPFGWGLFDYDDDDNVNNTMAYNATNLTFTGPFNCVAFKPMFDYLNDVYNFVDENFNPFYEPEPLNITTTPAPQQG